jgi:sulfhydrogenase subunit beta (sulfur reductase)
MEEKIISKENLLKLCSDLLKNNVDVITPGEKGYVKIKSENEVALSSKAKHTKASFKEYVFPKSEPIIYYKKNQNDVEIIEPKVEEKTTVIFGAKPCDIRSINILSKIFNWDYKDEFFNTRARNTVLIGLMCEFADEFCFCTSVNLSPTSVDGSDIFLLPLDENNFAVRNFKIKVYLS